MTAADVLRRLSDEATAGPWEHLGPTSGRMDDEGELHPFVLGPNGENAICVMEGDWAGERADAQLIAVTRNALPLICDVLDSVRLDHAQYHSEGEDGECVISSTCTRLAALDAHFERSES